MVIAVIGAAATMAHRGPIPYLTSDPAQQAQLFQTFIAVLLLTCLPVAAELSARRRLTQELAEREDESAADESKRQGGAAVSIKDTLDQAKKDAQARLAELDP